MRDALEVLLDELRAIKGEGATRVVVSEEAMSKLKSAVEQLRSSEEPSIPEDYSLRSEPLPAQKKEPVAPAFPPPPKIEIPTSGTKAEKLAAVCSQMLADPICNKHLHPGKKLVFGVGNPDSPVIFCGEAPGAEEETMGEPFVGPAGQLLTKIIAATGLSRDDVYIGNIMKWRPETGSAFGNRPPTQEEMTYCLPYIKAQISIISPRVIVALGMTATNGLLGFDPDRKMGAIRGHWFEFCGVPLIPTYHPSYLLRNSTMKAKRMVWEDFMLMMEKLSLPISEKQRGYFLPKPSK